MDGLESGEELLQFRLQLGLEAQKCYWARDIPGIIAVLAKLEKLAQQATTEEERYRIDLSTATVTRYAAVANLDFLNFEDCFNLCADVYTLLNQPHVAEGRLSKSHPAYRLAICGFLTALADAKWKSLDPGTKDRVLPASAMVDRYCSMQMDNIADPAGLHPPRSKKWSNLHIYLLCGAMLFKQCYRYDSGELPRIKQAMDDASPGILDNPDSPYFWERRIVEVVFSKDGSAEELAWLFDQRLSRIEHYLNGFYDLGAILESQANELEFLQQHLQVLRTRLT